MTSLKTSIKTITYLSDIGCLEIQGSSLGRDNNPLLNGRYQQEDEREYRQHQGQGRVPQYQRWHFAHCQRTGITTRFILLTSMIRCCIYCGTSLLYLRLLHPSLMGLEKWSSLNQRVKPFVGPVRQHQ